jgi:hypothetical protein
MSTAEMTKRIAGASPRLEARIAGLLYLLIFIVAPSGAATATPAKMIVNLTCDAGVAFILYDLLKPVNRSLALLAVLFRLIFVAVMTVNSLSYFGAVVLYQSGPYSPAAFNTGYGIAMVPFGLHCLLIGYLIFRSIFLPRILGILMALAGLGYLTFLCPRLGSHLFCPWIDFRLSRTRDVAAAKAFFKKAIRQEGRSPQTITLDGYAASHRSYGRD